MDVGQCLGVILSLDFLIDLFFLGWCQFGFLFGDKVVEV